MALGAYFHRRNILGIKSTNSVSEVQAAHWVWNWRIVYQFYAAICNEYIGEVDAEWRVRHLLI